MKVPVIFSFVLIQLLAFVASSRAGTISINVSSAPSSLAGFTTDTVTAVSSDPTDKLVGFDFVGNGSNYGFFGAMNQINPVGQPTVFQDNNPFFAFVGAQVDQDSQFKVQSFAGIAINPFESGTKLQAAFNYTAANAALATNQWTFAQIARPNAGSVNYAGTITVRDAQGHDSLAQVSSPICLDCEPHPYAPIIDNVIASNPGMVMGTFLATNAADSWHDFMFQSYAPGFGGSGSGPAVPATFDPATQKFSWTTLGSAPGTYVWQVSATNVYGTDSGSITVRIVAVPEPGTLSLLSLVALSTAGLIRHRGA
jgi:hypothetical protein